MYGIIEVLLGAGILKHTGVRPRGLFSKLYTQVPGMRDLMGYLGGVGATRENLRALLEAGESPCIFPGGVREVAKRKGEQYQLFWGESVTFARMAVEYGYSITPVAIMGPEHAYTIVWDANDILNSPPLRLLRRYGLLSRLTGSRVKLEDLPIPPISRGIGPTAIPRPERCYISICPPLDTQSYRGREGDKGAMLELREQVAGAIRDELKQLEKRRDEDPDKGMLRTLLTRHG